MKVTTAAQTGIFYMDMTKEGNREWIKAEEQLLKVMGILGNKIAGIRERLRYEKRNYLINKDGDRSQQEGGKKRNKLYRYKWEHSSDCICMQVVFWLRNSLLPSKQTPKTNRTHTC